MILVRPQARSVGRGVPPANATIYQIYPATFQDSNDDGFGDLKGITSRLDYLAGVGIDYIWLSPFFPSPQADGGYDISDYCAVDPRYGTIEDFKELTSQARKHGIGVLIDLVMNHTSENHPWFKESRSSPDNPKRDYYVWAKEPNNWESLFGGSAWERDPLNYDYYLHTFLPEQPDLNWDNPKVRAEFVGPGGVLEFWAKLGVIGFRCDAIWWISKNPSLADDVELNPDYDKREYHFPYSKKLHENSEGWKNLFAYLNQVADKAASLGCFLLTEGYPRRHLQLEDYLLFYRKGRPNIQPMMFELIDAKWKAAIVKKTIDAYQGLLQPGEIPSYVLGNHDSSRIASRVGSHSAKAAMTLLLTLPGHPVIYNGDELAMEDTKIPAGRIHDPISIRLKAPRVARDPERTPIQWTDGRNAGFSTAHSKDLWLPVNQNYRHGLNVRHEAKDPHSMLNYTRLLIKLRRKIPALREGAYQPYETGHQDVFGFRRVTNEQEVLVLINFSKEPMSIKGATSAGVLASTHAVIDKDRLAPHEARLLLL